MKKLTILFSILIITLIVTPLANAQGGSAGVDNVYLGMSEVDGFSNLYIEAAHVQPVLGPLVTRAGIGVGVSQFQSLRTEIAGQRFMNKELLFNLQPSIMAGLRVPVHPKLNVGIYTGYQSNINEVDVSHHYVPISFSFTITR